MRLIREKVLCPTCGGIGFLQHTKIDHESCIVTGWREECPQCKGWRTIDPPITNAEKIREMTDEEIAEKLLALEKGELAPESFPLLWCEAKAPGCDLSDPSFVCTDELAKACILRWLRSPADDE